MPGHYIEPYVLTLRLPTEHHTTSKFDNQLLDACRNTENHILHKLPSLISKPIFFSGASETRTRNQRIKSPMRYQLRQCSKRGVFFVSVRTPIENSPVLPKLRSPLIFPVHGKALHMPIVFYLFGGLLSRPPPLGLPVVEGQPPLPLLMQ